MEKEIRNDLTIEYTAEEAIKVEIRYNDVTWEQAFRIIGGFQTQQIKSFTWE